MLRKGSSLRLQSRSTSTRSKWAKPPNLGTNLAATAWDPSDSRTADMQWWTRQQLRARDPKRRKVALEKLAERSSSDLEESALAALDDADPQVRVAAVDAIACLEPERAAVCLARAATHRDPPVRERVAKVFPTLKYGNIIEPLSRALRDSHDTVRSMAARSLEALAWHPETESDIAAFAAARHDYRTAAQCGSAAIEPLLVALGDSTCPNRRGVVIALSELGDTRTTKALISAARDPDPNVRVVAFAGLGDLHEPAVADTIRAGLRDSNPNVRTAAAESLGKLRDAASIGLLIETSRDSHWEVRKTAVEALGRLQEKGTHTALIARLNDSDYDVRLAAVDSLAQLSSSDAIEALVGSLVDVHAPVRRAAHAALRTIDARWEQSAGAQAAQPKLKAALSANDYLVRQAAAEALTRIGAATTVDQAPSTLSHAGAHRHQASLEVFVACLKSSDRDLRLAAVEALGRIQDPTAYLPISELLADPNEDRWVRAAAEQVLPGLKRGRGAPNLSGIAEIGSGKIVPLTLWEGESKQRSNRV